MRFVIAACGLMFASLAFAEPIDSANVRVIDGDTIRVSRAKPDIRLVGLLVPPSRVVCP